MNTRIDRRHVWAALVIIVVVIAGSLAYWTSLDPNGGNGATADGDAGTVKQDPVADYAAFAQGLQGGPPLTEQMLAEGLRTLAGALGTVSVGDAELNADLRITAEHVLLNPGAPETADLVRTRLVAAAAALDRENGASSAVSQSAEAISPQQPLTEQDAALRQFFIAAAAGIQQAGGAGT